LSVETTVIIPTLDDELTLGATVQQLNQVMAASGPTASPFRPKKSSAMPRLNSSPSRVPLLYSGLLVNALGAGAVYCLAAGVCAVGLLFLVKLAFLR